jgi:hypothetical protein
VVRTQKSSRLQWPTTALVTSPQSDDFSVRIATRRSDHGSALKQGGTTTRTRKLVGLVELFRIWLLRHTVTSSSPTPAD